MIIGITGSFGAGKGEVVNYLVKKGFSHYSARKFITAEIEKRGLPVNRDTMTTVANDLRANYGPTYIIESLFNEAKAKGGNAIVESIREVLGVRFIKSQGGVVLGIDAEPKLRYERAFKRGSETDNVTYEQWLRQEQIETNPDDPTKQDIFAALKESDVIVENSGTIEDLQRKLDLILEKYET